MRSETGIKDLSLGNKKIEMKQNLFDILLKWRPIMRYVRVLSTKIVF